MFVMLYLSLCQSLSERYQFLRSVSFPCPGADSRLEDTLTSISTSSVCTHAELTDTHSTSRVTHSLLLLSLWGHPIGVMVFILYKLYFLSPYINPTPKLSPHRRLCISTFPKKNSLCMIYKRFEKWGHGSMSS